MNSNFSDVLVLDDDLERQLALKISLEFMGLNCHIFDFVTWLQRSRDFDLSRIRLVMIGQSSLPIALDKLITELRVGQRPLPKLLLCDWPELKPGELQQLGILGSFLPPYRYNTFIDLLHRCHVFFNRDEVASQPVIECEGFVGQSERICDIRSLIAQVACRDVSVLITGESGTGKEVVARGLHQHSPRCDKPFVPVNCGAIPSELLESELFGHEKGAFTGAISSRAGRFELADGGTLFLDEIGDMPLPMQVKLLRVLQERQFERVGGSRTVEVDVRIITATHKNLEEMILTGEFREDLYYRLNVFPIEMPPLRERVVDLPLLIAEFSKRLESQGLGGLQFLPDAMESLRRHPWPGNVRELSNLLERLAIIHPDGVIGVSELPPKFRHVDEPDPTRYEVIRTPVNLEMESQGVNSPPAKLETALWSQEQGMDLKQYLETTEQQLIEQALDQSAQVVARAARVLGIRRTTLVEKMRKYGIVRL
jgi:sigma-54 specific flagellar transcriptional regulator A